MNGAGGVFWAVSTAVFSAATAILAKIGLRDIDPDFATLTRTVVILAVPGILVALTGKRSNCPDVMCSASRWWPAARWSSL